MRKVTTDKRLERSMGTLRSSSQTPISSVNSSQETLAFSGRSGHTQIAHPFCTDNAWIRSIPNAGTRVTLQYNKNTNDYDFIAYVPVGVPSKIKQYNSSTGLYRPLKSGEHEIKSSGNAVSYWGSRCYQTTRAGAVKTVHDGENLNHISRAPTVHIQGHRNRTDQLGHEMRFGVVKRPLSATKEMIIQKAPLSNASLGIFNYAYEWSTFINNDNDDMLLDWRLGDVYDDVPMPGVPYSTSLVGTNSIPLRARLRFGVTQEPLGIGMDEYSEVEVDSLGNMNVTLAKLAVIGFAMKVPMGSYGVDSGQTVTINGKLGISMGATAGAIELNGKTGVSLLTQNTVTIKAKAGIEESTDAEVTITGSTGVTVKSNAKIVVQGSGGVQLIGAMGSTGRFISTNPNCYVTGAPNYLDTTLKN